MYKYIRNHTLVFIMAMGVGFVYLLPQLTFQFALGDYFQGVYRVVSGDETYYMTRAQDIVDGHTTLSNTYFYEHKDGLPMQFFLGDFIIAYPAKLFSISPYILYQAYDFIFPALLFVLVYYIFFALLGNTFWSLFFSGWMFLVQYLHLFNRPYSPQFIFVFAAALTIMLLSIVKQKNKSLCAIIFSGIIFGLLFNLYTYYWTHFFVLLFLYGIFLLWQKKYQLTKNIFTIMSIGVIVGLPYFYFTWKASRSDIFLESLKRLGFLETRIPSGIQIVIPACILLFCFLYRWKKNNISLKKVDGISAFLFFCLLSSMIVVNHHIITGHNLLFSSHYEPLSYFFIAFSASYLLLKNENFLQISKSNFFRCLAVLFLISRFFPLFMEKIDYGYNYFEQQKYAPVFSWLNDNSEKDSVVMTFKELSNIIPAYTHNNVFFAPLGGLFFVSRQEMLDRFTLNNFWNEKFDYEFAKNNLFAVSGIELSALGGKQRQLNKARSIFGKEEVNLDSIYYPEERVQEILDYRRELTENDWLNAFRKYRIDYIITEGDNKDSSLTDQYDFIRPVFKKNGVDIFAIVR